jgi:hypothetical protein
VPVASHTPKKVRFYIASNSRMRGDKLKVFGRKPLRPNVGIIPGLHLPERAHKTTKTAVRIPGALVENRTVGLPNTTLGT